MQTIEEIVEQGIAAHEQCVRESIAIDCAWQQGRLDEFLEKKYARVMEECYGSSNGNSGGDS